MKTRNRLYYKSRLRLLCLLTALLGLFGAGQTWAGNPTNLTVGGTSVLNGSYWKTNADGTLTEGSADNYNVHYDGNGTLTLKDATIKGTNTIGHVGTGIYAEGDLTIVLEGSSTVTGVQDPNGDSQSIRVSENLTIQGGGSLTAQGAETSSGSSYGIFVIGSFTQQGGSVTASGGDVSGSYNSTGLYVYGSTVTVQGGTLTATGGTTGSGSYGISANGSVTVSDATVTATGGTGKYSYGLYVSSNSPSVTLSDSGSLTARSGSATSKASGIYFQNPFGSTGSVTVGNGSTLLTNSVIRQDMYNTQNPLAPTGDGSWLIYGQSNQTSAVGGNYTLKENITIPEDVTFTIPAGGTLTVPQGKTLTVDGTLTNQGTLSIAAESCLTGSGSLEGDGSFTAVAVTGIEVPDDVTCADYEKKVVLAGPTVLGHAFTADGWTLTFTKGEVTLDGCSYTVTASKEGSESIEKTFTAQHSFGEDGKCPCGASRPTQDAEGCYQVADAFQLFWFAGLVNGTLTDDTEQKTSASAVLTADIELSGETWTPIGSESTPYTGTFDGQGYTISGMTIENAESYSGLFGNVTGTVRDFTVTGTITITGSEAVSKVGGAVGSLGIATAGGTVSGVTSDVDITVSAGNDHIGGVVGSMPENSSPTVENCVYTGDINITVAAGSVAGIVGYIRTGTIQNCANQGSISVDVGGTGSVGGILGYCNNKSIKITACYNTGIISASGTANVGAIVGNNRDDNNHVGQATVSNCYYLTGSADKGQGQLDTDAVGTVVKDDNAFTSGEVACLLQGDQTVQVWGQTLGTDNYPVLTTDEAKRVYAAKLYKGSAENVSELYKNASGISSPEEPNALLVIENAPSASTGTNIVVKSGDAYTCANLVLTDGADFYTPVAFTATQAAYSRTLPETSKWGTIVLPFSAETIEGASLYEATEIVADGSEESILAVQPVTGSALEANTPALFQGETAGTTVTFSASGAEVAATADAVLTKTIGTSGYTLTGSLSTINPLATGDLFIAKDLFWSVGTQNTVGMQAFRAYIDAPDAGPAQVNALRILVGDATSIRQALSDGTLPVDVYNLQGVQLRRNVERNAALEGLPAGIYIVGGKKVVKK